jgi:protein-disulfide isomerase
MGSLGSDETSVTRKQRREQARAARKAAEQAVADGAVRRKRVTQLGGSVALAIVAIVVVVIASSGGSKAKVLPATSPAAKTEVAAVSSLLAGTTQTGSTLGRAAAPVTLQYFGDLECPVCSDFTRGALPAIIQKWVKTGKLKVEYRSLSTATGNAEAGGTEPEGTFNEQQLAALAAGRQNKAWDYLELFYREQGEEGSGYVTESYLQGLAQQVPGLNLAQWTTDRGAQALKAQMATDAQEANNRGFRSTPSFLIGKTGSHLEKYEYSSLTDPSGFEVAFEKALTS